MSFFEDEYERRRREHEEQAERTRLAEEALRLHLILLRNISGADAASTFKGIGNAGLGTLAAIIETLLAAVEALSTRVTTLEQDV